MELAVFREDRPPLRQREGQAAGRGVCGRSVDIQGKQNLNLLCKHHQNTFRRSTLLGMSSQRILTTMPMAAA